VIEGLVLPVGIRGFDDQRVDRTGGGLGVPHDGQTAPSDISREDQAVVASLAHSEVHRRGAENVASLQEVERQMLAHMEHPSVRHPDHQILNRNGITK
jgi:hypothetical protein